ncbi:Hypothetical protein NTJ_01726 [Nesidiocoris tenuis]|uniref:Uncharacterized protein n=1 Tax=Nesidiocoris tenuis TaxID=355587 RepID=A0ABN7ACM8_9HEMI|nr:Hypothetical protein NTJ_01726 [Nesidiocoris tenuis]
MKSSVSLCKYRDCLHERAGVELVIFGIGMAVKERWATHPEPHPLAILLTRIHFEFQAPLDVLYYILSPSDIVLT